MECRRILVLVLVLVFLKTRSRTTARNVFDVAGKRQSMDPAIVVTAALFAAVALELWGVGAMSRMSDRARKADRRLSGNDDKGNAADKQPERVARDNRVRVYGPLVVQNGLRLSGGSVKLLLRGIPGDSNRHMDLAADLESAGGASTVVIGGVLGRVSARSVVATVDANAAAGAEARVALVVDPWQAAPVQPASVVMNDLQGLVSQEPRTAFVLVG
jgi:hypothetical protein